jgi:hypothetical protein
MSRVQNLPGGTVLVGPADAKDKGNRTVLERERWDERKGDKHHHRTVYE